MGNYRYQLEKYRGRSTRYTCPQCGRKQSFTRYIDTYNNIYISDNVGMCNRIDKCGYHYTPKQYYTDNPWKRDDATTNNGSLRPPKQYYTDNPWKRDGECRSVGIHRKNDRPTINTNPHDYIPEWVWEYSRSQGHKLRLPQAVLCLLSYGSPLSINMSTYLTLS